MALCCISFAALMIQLSQITIQNDRLFQDVRTDLTEDVDDETYDAHSAAYRRCYS